jgi:hypothetical protein
MTARDPKPAHKKSLLISLATGAVLIPLAAYGASSLVNATSGPEPAAPSTVTTAAVTAAPVGPADIDIACGDEGLQLVAAEADGSISDVQQAALDALRGICADQGRPLPGPTALAPTATTPTTDAVPSTSVGTSPDSDDDDHDRDDDHGGHGRGGDDDDHEDDD